MMCTQTIIEANNEAGGIDENPSPCNSPRLVAKWLANPDDWSEDDFLSNANSYLLKKNGSVDIAEMHLLGILVTQISIYIKCFKILKSDGLIVGFNNGVTLGPNPHISIADKALNRILQLMKELEISPRSRDGYKPAEECSLEFKEWLKGP